MRTHKPTPLTYDPYALPMNLPSTSTQPAIGNADLLEDAEIAEQEEEFPVLEAAKNGYLMEDLAPALSLDAPANGYAFGEDGVPLGLSQSALKEQMKVPVPSGPWAHSGPGKWAPAPEPPTAKALKTKARGEQYAHEAEDASSFRGAPGSATKFLTTPNAHCAHVQTRMFSEAEGEEHALSVKDGALTHQGAPLDTSKASGTGTWANGGQGRYLYARSTEGQTRAVDAWKEHLETPMSDEVDGQGTVPTRLQMVNHSTLLGGKDAQGAGEIRADQGKHAVISDRSGHYKPDNEMLYNTVQGLVDQGLSAEATTVEMNNKNGVLSGIVPKDALGQPKGTYDPNDADLQVGALEFLSYGGDKNTEARLRQARENRMGLHAQINGFDAKSLAPTSTKDRSAPKLETMGESIFRGDKPSIKSKIARFGGAKKA